MPGGALPILYVPMFSWKYFSFMKQERSEEIKRVVCVKGGSSTRAFSWGLGTPLGSHPWMMTSLRRTHSYWNLPYNNKPNSAPTSNWNFLSIVLLFSLLLRKTKQAKQTRTSGWAHQRVRVKRVHVICHDIPLVQIDSIPQESSVVVLLVFLVCSHLHIFKQNFAPA
jgi:hypothetical protein